MSSRHAHAGGRAAVQDGMSVPARRRLPVVSRPSRASDHGTPAVAAARADAAADALGSVIAEGLDPGRAEPLLSAWARGVLSDAQLEQARLRLLADRSITVEELLAGPRAA